jgi:cytochrome c oxidase subunit II
VSDTLHSVLAPHGPQAGQIAALGWVLFVFGTAVLALVIITAWLAIRGSPRIREVLASDWTILTLGLAFPAVALTLLLAYGVWLMRVQLIDAEAADRIEVTGEQWWWRVIYAGATSVVSANEIRIPVGKPVAFTLKASDVIHSFWVPSLGGKVDMIPGRTTRLRLTAERAGIYRGQCAEYCGGPHALMALEVVAMPESEYDTWLVREAAPAIAPANEAEQRGQSLFIGGGCGTCHTVRGTAAKGAIGPDLTHVGSRRSVGLDTLRLSAENLTRFIRDGQHIKPGNRMPEFRVFSAEEHAALAAYLLRLR